MHLRSLTLKGFKSFAAPTTLVFEPGVTAVVGQNGSGKSNIADALSWVMGEQGAKSLRGAKMDDVIFAGTSKRPALGRAEVTLVIDNTDGALPIDYTEVAITRRMYRDGGGEYLINGDSCRLMDVQELLSDSGIGSQMHVIVGQNRLATMLGARPHQWRELIEEAAGVHKHRKRKDRALRKLETTSADMTRVGDLVGELRRQLKPLGRQAEAAKKAHAAGAKLRDARRRLAVAKIARTNQAAAATGVAARETAARKEAAQRELDAKLSLTSADEEALRVVRAAAGKAREQAEQLGLVVERVRATARVAHERARQLAKHAAAPQFEEDLTDQRAELIAAHAQLEGQLAVSAAELEAARGAERAAKAEASQVAQRQREQEQKLQQLRAQAAKASGQAASLAGKSQALLAEADHARHASAEAHGRAERARADASGLRAEQEERDLAWQGAQLRADEASRTESLLVERAEAATAAAAGLKGTTAALAARIEALESTVAPADGAAWLFAHASAKPTGVLAERLAPTAGYERALSAALGAFAEAVVMDSSEAALAAAAALGEAGEGQAALVFPPGQAHTKAGERSAASPGRAEFDGSLPKGARMLLALVEADDELAPALFALLAGVVVVDAPQEARAVLAQHPRAKVVTKSGDLIGLGWTLAGVGRSTGVLDVRAQIVRARDELADAERQLGEAQQAAEHLRAELAAARQASVQARAELTGAAADRAVAGESLARSATQVETLEMESRRTAARAEALAQQAQDLHEAIEQAEAAYQQAQRDAEELAARVEQESVLGQQTSAALEELQARRGAAESEHAALRERAVAAKARNAELEAREQRLKAAQEEALRQERARLRAAAAHAVAVRLGDRAQTVCEAAQARHERLRRRVAEQIESMREGQSQVAAARDRLAAAERAAHAAELAATTAEERSKAAETEVIERFGMTPADLVAEFAEEDPAGFDQDQLAHDVRLAEREIAAIGQVNPLALEEFAALEERHAFLTAQLDDLTKARKDLLDVVKEVDDLVVQVIREAYEDVSREFGEVFRTLFPGGEGSLELTEPHDLLATGIEVKARPAGKKVQRLSLLSGGEQSLTALAVLVSIFRARPSPFYILDEVEAALDEVNLRRLLVILEDLARSAQLIIITHQRPTMEIADALYGMSMQGDGVTHVVSQKTAS
ncbi:chromosome segregation protein SMC [Segniliparus rotundus DSM 44985]|uniref:Chromosome partition protein Smc n=1 Tax=Segniliparus rotundus (strain ATCC BAA-972 / CDC 1076 / CIP 108378 / DSM 44985 / JCM 13578) TaxID=640132 RepID=D6Z8M0_SEGRD|nr:chromosome segregation protein SMC [Segniliparus rotundus]ADG98300.1 chromosome segregation protein SMC [Segniliparus rotundus DSM 44985]